MEQKEQEEEEIEWTWGCAVEKPAEQDVTQKEERDSMNSDYVVNEFRILEGTFSSLQSDIVAITAQFHVFVKSELTTILVSRVTDVVTLFQPTCSRHKKKKTTPTKVCLQSVACNPKDRLFCGCWPTLTVFILF